MSKRHTRRRVGRRRPARVFVRAGLRRYIARGHLRTGGAQAGDLVRKVMDDAARKRLVSHVVGHLSDGVTKPVLERALEYWALLEW